MFTLKNCFETERRLRSVFSWLTKTGAGRRFGTLPIGWYQIHQCHCIDILRQYVGDNPVRFHGGYIQQHEGTQWLNVILPEELFRQADDKCRQ